MPLSIKKENETMNLDLITRANRTLRSDITFRPALRFELDKYGEPFLVDIVHERRTICSVRADTLEPLADDKVLIDVVRMLWNVAQREFAAGIRAGEKAAPLKAEQLARVMKQPPHPLLTHLY
jgi:hypothetical protein